VREAVTGSRADILIRGGDVLSGSGDPAISADVAIADGRIVAVASRYEGSATRVIDARGLVVAPGFIDIKTHSDFTLPLTPTADSMIRQGVTTEVIGHCGFSVAPVLPGREALLREYLAGFAAWMPVRTTSFAEYLATFPACSVNVIMQVGHNTLRLMATGMDDRAPRADEMALMQHLLTEALDAGALGLSSGPFTPPGAYASAEELARLVAVLSGTGASYATHVRDEASGLQEAMREAIAAAEASRVRVHLVHFKLSGTDNWGGAASILAELEAARARGVRVDADLYPYTAAANPLRNLFPPWVQEGGVDEMLKRMARSDVRARVRAEFAARGLRSFGRIPSWDAVTIATAPTRPDDAGLTIADIARRRDVDPLNAACDYVIEDRGQTFVLIESINEDDVRALLRSRMFLVGSDGRAMAPDSVTGRGKPHPRNYGTFPRLLGRYVRELGLLSLPEAVWKITGGPARVLGLTDRGVLREGYCADVTIFDPATILDHATFADPSQYPDGIPYVILNGVLVVDGGEHTKATPGRVLRRRGDAVR
jgi:N-acyl-D-aspartate/D-glutamate deacylase